MSGPDTARCPHCFGATTATPCPHCGWQPGHDNPPPALALGRVLDGRYRVGRVLGHGGFGITYLAWDDNLQLRLAIKEYLPRDCVSRGPDGVSLAVYSGQAGDQFAYGLDRFLEEARTLAHFDQHPGIVTVKNFFRAHGTGYCVMDYVAGITLRQYLDQQPGGRISVEAALRLLTPVMDALRAVHKEGLLHRDLAPDNIYLTQDGRIKLLDFGAARFAASEHSKSLSIILKPGYAPEEQYRTKGRQGPWTDVYGLAATLYRAITGQVPPEALDRLDNDDLVPPSQLGIAITPDQEAVLLKALVVKAGQRYQSMWELQQAWRAVGGAAPSPAIAIDSSGPVPPTGAVAPTAKPQAWAKTTLLPALVALLLIIATVALIRFPWPGTTAPTPPLAGGSSSLTPPTPEAPTATTTPEPIAATAAVPTASPVIASTPTPAEPAVPVTPPAASSTASTTPATAAQSPSADAQAGITQTDRAASTLVAPTTATATETAVGPVEHSSPYQPLAAPPVQGDAAPPAAKPSQADPIPHAKASASPAIQTAAPLPTDPEALAGEKLAPRLNPKPDLAPAPTPRPGATNLLEACWGPQDLRGRPGERKIRNHLTPDHRPPEHQVSQTPLSAFPQIAPRSLRSVTPTNGEKLIALTFDLCEQADEVTGYDGDLVDTLRAHGVKATFYAGGKWMQSHPERTMQLMADPLFELGNHAWTHGNLRVLPGAEMANQIRWTQAEYERLRDQLLALPCAAPLAAVEGPLIPRWPETFRFPYGTCNSESLQAVATAGLYPVQWSIVTGDPAKGQTAARIVKTVMSQLKPGSIVVAHGNGRGWHTAEALKTLIPALRKQGYRFVTVSELLWAGTHVTAAQCYEVREGDNLRYDKLFGKGTQ